MSIAVTGGTGTLGRALMPRLLEQHGRVVAISRDEVKIDQLMQDFNHPHLRAFIGDVRDRDRLVTAFDGCDYVIHAAALKRVTSGYSPSEMIKTNIEGTLNVIWAADKADVQKVLFVSSDKAVHATNLYGATKFAAECYAVQANSYTYPRGLSVSCTRYGNVLGSRGSVTEIWKQIPLDKPISVTSAAMTRFLITQSEAVDFILQSLNEMEGGEVFVPVLPGFSILDLAMAMYGGDRLVEFSGLRPGGEKLHESLISDEEWSRLYWLNDKHQTAVIWPSFNTWDARLRDLEPVARDYGRLFRSDLAERLTLEELEGIVNANICYR